MVAKQAEELAELKASLAQQHAKMQADRDGQPCAVTQAELQAQNGSRAGPADSTALRDSPQRSSPARDSTEQATGSADVVVAKPTGGATELKASLAQQHAKMQAGRPTGQADSAVVTAHGCRRKWSAALSSQAELQATGQPTGVQLEALQTEHGHSPRQH